MKSFMYRFPGDFSAIGPIRENNERDARAFIRHHWKLNRLPNGFEIWESDGRI